MSPHPMVKDATMALFDPQGTGEAKISPWWPGETESDPQGSDEAEPSLWDRMSWSPRLGVRRGRNLVLGVGRGMARHLGVGRGGNLILRVGHGVARPLGVGRGRNHALGVGQGVARPLGVGRGRNLNL